MSKTATQGETPIPPDTIEFLDRPAVLKFFGGNRALHTSTLYRGISDGTYPQPVKVSRSAVRWLKSECEAAAQRMLAARDEPTKPERRGRPRRQRIA